MTRLRSDILLLLTAIIWGTTFVAQKNANAAMGPISFVGARFLLSALVIMPLAVWEAKKQTAPLSLKTLTIAGFIGLSLFVGAILQQIGLVTTTATNGGFLTALYIVFVPFFVWLLTRQAPSLIVVIACVISIGGGWLLADRGRAETWTIGDVLVVIADLAWAMVLTLVPIFLKRVHRPFFLSFAQSMITGVLGLVAGFIFESATKQGMIMAVPALLYAGLLSSGVGFTLQIVAQKHTPAAEAALITSLQSVFAAVAGAVLLQEHLTLVTTTGCVLILFGVVIVEIGPLLLQGIRPPRP